MSSLEPHRPNLSRDDRRLASQLEGIDQQQLAVNYQNRRTLERTASETLEAMQNTSHLFDAAVELSGGDMGKASLLLPFVQGYARDAQRTVRGGLF